MTRYLRPGERLLWWGKPDTTVIFTRTDLFLIPFSLMWGGFAVFWEVSVFSTHAPLFFRLWGVPFVAIGIYMIVGRFIAKRRRKDNTCYAVTDQRAIVLVGESNVSDVPLKYQPLSIHRSRDGRHVDAVFGTSKWPGAMMYANTGMELFNRSTGEQIGFYDVADPEPLLHAIEVGRSS